MLIVIAFYLALSGATLWAAHYLHEADRRHARQIAMILLFSCCISNSTWISRALWTWPILDAAIAWFVAVRYRLKPRAWKWGIVQIAVAQQAAHIAWAAGDKSRLSEYIYETVLNGLFIAQLAHIAFSGSKRVADGFRDFVADWFRPIGGRGFALLRGGRNAAGKGRR